MNPPDLRRDAGFLALLLVVFLFLAITTYTHLGEDAFITFRYAEQLARGHGLVYNPGERVEGYSNLLWVLVLAPFGTLGVPLHLAARVLATLAFGGLIVGGWWAGRRLGTTLIARWWLPVALAVAPYLHYHDDRGLETVPYAAALGGALLVLGTRGSAVVAAVLAGAAVLLRPEGIGFALALAPVAWMAAPGGRRRAALAVYLSIPIALFLAHLVLRQAYYGDWLPNTVIAKRPEGLGVESLVAYATTRALLPVVAIVGCGVAWRHKAHRPLAVGCLLLLAAAALFQLRAGDALNIGFRYLAPAFVPTVVGVWLLVLEALRTAPRGRPARTRLAMAALLLAWVPVTLFAEGPLYRYFKGNGDAPRSRLLVRLVEPRTYNLADRLRWFLHEPIFINAEAGRWVRDNLASDALVGIDQLGQVGFHMGADRRVMDLLGLADRRVARDGLTMDLLDERRPEYLVIESTSGSTFWPRSMRYQPTVPHLRPFVASAEFRARYEPRWFLRDRLSFSAKGFLVFERRDLQSEGPPRGFEEVRLGVSEEEFERWWGVL